MTALPGVAATLFAARLGERRVPVLLTIGLAATGVIAMLSFWAYYGDKTLGQSFSFFTLFGSVLLTVGSLYERKIDRALLRQLAVPLALWVLGTTFLVFLGFVHGGTDKPIELASVRFSGQLPSDNDLPHYFTEWFYANGHSGHPIYPPDWLASDRPPLQVGYLLSQRPFAFDLEGLNYQILSVMLQTLWIIALWALLLAAKLGRVTRALIMVTVVVSDIALLNGFYVWPKLLPAAMLIAAAALVVTPLWLELRRKPWAGVLVATLLALAMLGHGSSIFGAIPIAIVAAFRGLPSWRWIGAAVVAGIVLMAPWSAYQKYGEPPANRLAKWSLAGVIEVDSRSTREAIIDGYEEEGISGTLHNKAMNFLTMLGATPAIESVDWWAGDELTGGSIGDRIRGVRNFFFFNFFPSLGLLLLAPIAMLAGWRRRRGPPEDWEFAKTIWIVVLVGLFFWGMLMFGNVASEAIIHVGSYALPILAFAACVAGLRATFPRFANWFVAIAAGLMLAVYAPALDYIPGSSYSPLAILLALAGLCGFGALAFFPEGRLQVLGDSRRVAVEDPDREDADADVNGQRREQVQGAAGSG
jgi:hypothetical protein